MWADIFSKKRVGHVLLNWSKVASKFLQIASHYIRVEVTGKRVNNGVELGLKIPVNVFLWKRKSYKMEEKLLGEIR